MNYYDFALKDYKSAQTMYKYTDEYDIIVVSCQQYLEKALKYLLEINLGELNKTHKLTTLAHKLNIEYFNKYTAFFRQVQDYYFDKRYPSEDYITTTKEEAEYVFTLTTEIKEYMENNLIHGLDSKLKRSTSFNDLI